MGQTVGYTRRESVGDWHVYAYRNPDPGGGHGFVIINWRTGESAVLGPADGDDLEHEADPRRHWAMALASLRRRRRDGEPPPESGAFQS